MPLLARLLARLPGPDDFSTDVPPGGHAWDSPYNRALSLVFLLSLDHMPCFEVRWTGDGYRIRARPEGLDGLRCWRCARRLTRPANGRPPRYCSKGHRRDAEYARRRFVRQLKRLAA